MDVIETPEEWEAYKLKLTEDRRKLWQWQYRYSDSEGFQARFSAPGKPDLEIVTHSKAVQELAVKYRLK